MSEITARNPLSRLIVMPWRWGWTPFVVMLIVWLLIYVVSFPPMFVWLNTNAIQPNLLREALWGFYTPLDWLTENSDGAFAIYLWEIEAIRETPSLRWLLPEPEPLSDAAPVGP